MGGSVLSSGGAADTGVEPATAGPGAPDLRHRLSGNVPRTLDAKSRIVIPSNQRWAFVAGVFVLPFPGPCVALIPTDEFEKVERKLRRKQRETLSDPNALLALTSLATHSFPDAQGRVFLPEGARRLGDLEADDVTVVGRLRRLELWKPATYAAKEPDLLAALEAQAFTEAW